MTKNKKGIIIQFSYLLRKTLVVFLWMSSSWYYTAGSCISVLFRPFHSSATTSSGFPETLIMNGSGGFGNTSLHVSHHDEEFDNKARYHNHQALSGSVSMTVQFLRKN